ncbi:MAG: HAMP domain-containing histidine kinase [Eubacterium sp.]|nr:HAMP domain-containing histidine kinase [Eubacterium sp.]
MKKFKYSALKKAICIIIALATFLVSTGLITTCVMSYVYCDGERPENFTDTDIFVYRISDIVDGAAASAYSTAVNADTQKTMEQQRQAVVDGICKQYMEEYKSVSASYEDYYDFSPNDFSDNYNAIIKTKTSDYTFYVASWELYDGNYELMPSDEQTVKDIINSEYDAFIRDKISVYDTRVYLYNADVYYYAAYGKSNSSNIDKFDEKDVYKHDIYYVYKDGKATAKGISDENRDRITGWLSNDYAKKTDVYVYLDFPVNSGNGFNIISYMDSYSLFTGMMDFYNTAVKCYDNFITYIVFAVLMLVISFVAGFRYLLVAGKRDENTPAKLAFIDYVPLEIHLGVLGGLGFLATILIAFGVVGDFLQISILSVWVMVIYVAVMWLLLMEFSASVSRCIMAERKFYKNFLIFYILKLLLIIFKGIFKLLRKFVKRVGRLFKKANSPVKRLFGVLGYSPKKFKRNVILLAILYVVCNLIALGVIWLCYIEYYDFYDGFFGFLTLVLSLADVGVNVYLFIKFLSYIKKLDMIITAVSNHEDIALDVDTLPQSLKALAEGMRYTNAQLQSAVAKAVKDERLRTELITNVSHDLKTPLTSIINYVDLLSKCDIDDENAQQYIKVLGDKGAKLKRLIDDLIEASKVTSGNITVNLTKLNLYELCLQATVDAQEDFEKAGLDLIIKENGSAPTILADGPKSFRIIENLLSNARKYSAKASRVYVNVYEENGMGVFEIKNISAQPLDISPDELTQRFVRGDKSRNQEGNGLGLSIATELCRVQNGELEISIDGDLFKAKVKLPIAK